MEKKKLVFGVSAVLILIISFMLDKYAIAFFELIKNPVFDYLMGWITNIASVFVVLVLMTTLFFWEEKKKKYILPLWLSFLTTTAIANILKILIARARPFETLVIPILGVMNYSFPSSHVAIAFSVVPILDKEFPKLKWFWILFATLVGISRMYVQVHFLSDVIGGAILGYAIGRVFLWYGEKRAGAKNVKPA